MKLNLGCGNNKRSGYVNVDAFPECSPDMVFDLETTPWPWEDNSVSAVLFHHSLEHMGGEPKVFLAIMKELYRVCRNGAEIEIHAPHPRNDNFIGDPTHVRPITPQMMRLFDRPLNDEWKVSGVPATPLAHYLHVDFRMVENKYHLSQPYATRYASGTINDTILDDIREKNNIVENVYIKLMAVKD